MKRTPMRPLRQVITSLQAIICSDQPAPASRFPRLVKLATLTSWDVDVKTRPQPPPSHVFVKLFKMLDHPPEAIIRARERDGIRHFAAPALATHTRARATGGARLCKLSWTLPAAPCTDSALAIPDRP